MRYLIPVILFQLFSSPVYADDSIGVFGKWFYSAAGVETNPRFSAATFSAGNILAYRCYPEEQKCKHSLNANIKCKANSLIPLLVSSNSGAFSTTGICDFAKGDTEEGSIYEFIFSNFDEIHEVFKNDQYISIAVPMEAGVFKVIRFDLEGSSKAMEYVDKNAVPNKSSEAYLK